MKEEENQQNSQQEINKNKRFRKDKPWDNDPTLDKWKIEEFKEGDMKAGTLTEKSSFAVLFPQYREKYIDEVYPFVKKCLVEYGVKCELDKLEGSLTVSTTNKTWDPFIILKARDMIKLLSRSVPFEKAKLVLQDGIECDVIKIRHFVKNKERFIKRRQRLIGPKGMTLKALELLTECYILVQGSTVSVIGKFKQLKVVRRIVLDCMQNIHPVYHIKELMIKEELSKDPELKNENWDRFLPQFKKRIDRKKETPEARKKRKMIKQKKKQKEEQYNPFPPEQQPRKVDLELETGEYWEKKEGKDKKEKKVKSNKKNEEEDYNEKEVESKLRKSEIRKQEKEKKYIAPEEPVNKQVKSGTPTLEELKSKFMKKK